MSAPITGRVNHDRCDAANVVLPQAAFEGLLPKAVPLAKRDYVVRPGQTVASAGRAHGRWSTGWKGHALGYRCYALASS